MAKEKDKWAQYAVEEPKVSSEKSSEGEKDKWLQYDLGEDGHGEIWSKETQDKKYPQSARRIGQFAGGVAGGIVGARFGNPAVGAAFGGAIGGLGGRGIGNLVDIARTEGPQDAMKAFQQDMKKAAIVEASSIPISIAAGKVLSAIGGKIGGSLKNTNEKIRKAARGYLKNLNSQYGAQIQKFFSSVADKLKSVNVNNIGGAIEDALKKSDIIDDAGRFIGKTSDKRIFKIYTTFLDEATSRDISPKRVNNFITAFNGVVKATTKKGTKAATAGDRVVFNINNALLNELDSLGDEAVDVGIRKIKTDYAIKRQLYNRAEELFQPFGNTVASGNKGLSTMLGYYSDKAAYTKDTIDDIAKEFKLVPSVLRTIKRHSSLTTEGAGSIPFVGGAARGGVGAGRFIKTLAEPAPVKALGGASLKTGITELVSDLDKEDSKKKDQQ